MPLIAEFERLFANTVLEREFCDEETVAHAQEIQAAAQAEGKEESLQEILVELKALTPAQAQRLARDIMSRLDVVPQIPGYDSLKKIGTSGIAVMYAAHQQSVDRKVILKVMPTDDMEDSPMLKRFNQEARLRAQLNHKNIVGSIDFGTAPGCCFMVLVYIHDGVFLDDFALGADGGFLPPKTAARWMGDVAEGLRQVDKQGLVHGNVCPGNVLVAPNGGAWLTGFDFIAEIGTRKPIVGGAQARFAPPDRPRAPVRSTDMYALGCTLFMLLTRRDPLSFPRDKAPVATFVRRGADAGLAAIAYTLMQPAPADRYRDYDALIEDLRAVAAGKQPRHALPLPTMTQALAARVPDWPRPLPLRALLYLAAAGAGLAAAWGVFCGMYGNPAAKRHLPGELTARKHWQAKPDWHDRGDAAAELWLRASARRNTPEQRQRMLSELAQKYPDTPHGRAVVFYKLLGAPAAAPAKPAGK